MGREPTRNTDVPLRSGANVPKQERGKATMAKMLEAAREVLVARGAAAFTLQEVSHTGRVSIGAIYFRFRTKELLLKAVITEALAELAAQETAMHERLLRECSELADFLPRFIESYRDLLFSFHPFMASSMSIISADTELSALGIRSGAQAEELATRSILSFAREFLPGDHALRANAVYQIIFSFILRELHFEPRVEMHQARRLRQQELTAMCLAYLVGNPRP